jgi:hypothetical protein
MPDQELEVVAAPASCLSLMGHSLPVRSAPVSHHVGTLER